MSDVFYLRPIDPPLTPDGLIDASREADGCFGLHRVQWTTSFLREDGRRLLCWYRAPDAESARIALRELGADLSGVWPGRVLGGVGPQDPRVRQVSVLAEVPLVPGRPAGGELLDGLRRATDAHAELAFGFLSHRGDRLVCLLRGGDADGVRAALDGGGFAGTTAWPCQVVTPPIA